MGIEEQVEEREVLDSIFPDEITSFAADSFQIALSLDTVNDDGDNRDQPTIILSIKYPKAYPDEGPEIDLLPPPRPCHHPHFDFSTDKEELLNALSAVIQGNLGMVMIYALCSELKDVAERLIADRQRAARQVHDQQILQAEEDENKRFDGPPVTPESFAEWRRAFRRELDESKERVEAEEEERERKKNRGKELVEKLTGRQLWEKGLAGKVDEEDEEENALGAEWAKLKLSH